MPIKRRYVRRKTRPRTGRRRRTGRKLVATRFSRYKTLVPQHMYLKLKYNATGGISIPASSNTSLLYVTHAYNILGATSSPTDCYYATNWNYLYGSHRVLGIKYKYECATDSNVTSVSPPLDMFVYMNNQSNVLLNPSELAAQKYVKRKWITTARPGFLTGYLSQAKVQGVKSSVIYNEDDYLLQNTLVPIPSTKKLSYLYFVGFNTSGYAADYYTSITLTYYVRMEQPVLSSL
nr:MAG: capsid protein [Cressdnaviricota sp.]